jgi:hypothetical protein
MSYFKSINKDKAEICKDLLNSLEFTREKDESWTRVINTSSQLNKIYLTNNGDKLVLSEYAGIGLACVIGEVDVISKGKNQSDITIEFQIGSFPVSSLKVLIVFLLIILPIAYIFVGMISLVLLIPVIYIGILLLVKISTMKFILTKVSKSLNVDKGWEKFNSKK